MMTTSAYLSAWIVYLFAAAGLLLVLFRFTRTWQPVAFRIVLRAVLMVWLLMPAMVESGTPQESLAPAFMVLLFELTSDLEAARRIAELILMVCVAVIPLALGAHWALLQWRGKPHKLSDTQAPRW